tara:strand:- start:390 stop:554 length:165 start_codon:yes stop_codon:yes gene_type:complete
MSKRLGTTARRIRKFGDLASVVAKARGLGEVSKKVSSASDKLADMMEKISEETS